MRKCQIQPKSDATWQKTQFANLIRYVPSGTYFARIRVKGKLVRQSLKTDVISVAKLRLADLEKSLREQAASQDTIESGKMTMGDLLQVYKQNLERGTEVKPSTKKYRLEIVKAVLKSWPDLERMDVRKLTERAWKDWAIQYRANYSAGRFNGTLDTLRAILNIAVELGGLYRNPINAVDRARVRSQRLQLPDTETFQRFIEVIETGASRDSRNCADLVRFLTYGGFRHAECHTVSSLTFNSEIAALRSHVRLST